MSYKNNALKTLVLAILLLAPISLQAAVWTAINATNVWPGPSSSVSEYTFGGATFTDGQFNTDYYEKILVGPDQTGEISYSFNDWSIFSKPSFDYSDMTAPQIDLSDMRANFSSLVLTVWQQDGTPINGWDIGNPGWVPIIDNGNNTFSASWITPASRNGSPWGGGSEFSMTFTPTPVPMPASILLLCSALLVLFPTLKKPYK